MGKRQQATVAAFLAVAVGAATTAVLRDRAQLVQPAQAQTEDEKKRKERPKRKVTPSRPQPPPQSPTGRPALRKSPPPSAKVPLQKQLPSTEKTKKFKQPPTAKTAPLKRPQSAPELRKERVKRFPRPTKEVAPAPEKGPPPTFKKAPLPLARPLGPQGPAPKRIEDLKKWRVERVEEGGRRKVIQEGNRIIIKQNNRIIIRHDQAERFLRRPGAKSERRPDGNVETFYVRRDGVRIVTVVDSHGRLLRRYRRTRDGRERNIIDNRRFYRGLGVGVGIGVLGIIALNLPPPRVTIPIEQYIVDYETADDDDLYEALDAPPIEDLDRAYSLEEIRDNYELRARVRSIDIHTINFEFGSWEVPPDQYHKLERIARAILRVLERNPDAVLMLAGHTDAVGPEDINMSISDRRATAVADVLSDEFDVPAENLVTQGYGEQYLKIDTQDPEPRNRRVSFLNLTRLMAER